MRSDADMTLEAGEIDFIYRYFTAAFLPERHIDQRRGDPKIKLLEALP